MYIFPNLNFNTFFFSLITESNRIFLTSSGSLCPRRLTTVGDVELRSESRNHFAQASLSLPMAIPVSLK
jgi:hypothetical protein